MLTRHEQRGESFHSALSIRPPVLQLCLLGAPQIWWQGVDLARSLPDKQQALLYLLAIEGPGQQAVARTVLARMLWGEWSDEAARANLRVALSHLRRALPGVLDIDARRVGFVGAGAAVLSDLALLGDALLPGASAACRLAGARVWRGELLADFTLPGCDEFERWCAVQRQRAAGMALALQRTLVRACEAAGEWDAAIRHARALLRLDAADEAAHMVLMRLLAGQGERTAALRQYAECVEALAEQFGARPSACCYALYVRIHADTLPGRVEMFEQMAASPAAGAARPPPGRLTPIH
jgi:DNA-binding SARP family transcriptional activator